MRPQRPANNISVPHLSSFQIISNLFGHHCLRFYFLSYIFIGTNYWHHFCWYDGCECANCLHHAGRVDMCLMNVAMADFDYRITYALESETGLHLFWSLSPSTILSIWAALQLVDAIGYCLRQLSKYFG